MREVCMVTMTDRAQVGWLLRSFGMIWSAEGGMIVVY